MALEFMDSQGTLSEVASSSGMAKRSRHDSQQQPQPPQCLDSYEALAEYVATPEGNLLAVRTVGLLRGVRYKGAYTLLSQLPLYTEDEGQVDEVKREDEARKEANEEVKEEIKKEEKEEQSKKIFHDSKGTVILTAKGLACVVQGLGKLRTTPR